MYIYNHLVNVSLASYTTYMWLLILLTGEGDHSYEYQISETFSYQLVTLRASVRRLLNKRIIFLICKLSQLIFEREALLVC